MTELEHVHEWRFASTRVSAIRIVTTVRCAGCGADHTSTIYPRNVVDGYRAGVRAKKPVHFVHFVDDDGETR